MRAALGPTGYPTAAPISTHSPPALQALLGHPPWGPIWGPFYPPFIGLYCVHVTTPDQLLLHVSPHVSESVDVVGHHAVGMTETLPTLSVTQCLSVSLGRTTTSVTLVYSLENIPFTIQFTSCSSVKN